jgi:phosphoribosylformylglycinamidine synthase II
MTREDLFVARKTKSHVFEVNLNIVSNDDLQEVSQQLGLALNKEEIKSIRTYFRRKRRNPTDVELQTIGQTWSEHCFHKTFKSKIRFGKKTVGGLFKTYIAGATQKTRPRWCFSVFEDNAGIVRFEGDYGIAIKVETHNHPSAVEPFGGAATGTGGVIRDILGVWADPIACTDVLGFGPLDVDASNLPAGVKHPKYVYTGVVAGIGSYGNNMGIPTVNGAVYFDDSYTGNVVVYCGCVGLLSLRKFRKDPKAGDLVVLAGGKTGRDGIHGVTFASAELTEKSEEVSRPAVQIADPIEEEKLKRAVVAIRDLGIGSSITDLGGGGLSSALGETAKRAGCGARVDLDLVPLKHSGLAPWEIYVSESQERMLLTVHPENLEKLLRVFSSEDVDANAIGELTDDMLLRLDYHGEVVAEIDMSFLFEPVECLKIARFKQRRLEEPVFPQPANLTGALMRLLSSPNIASRENIIRSYDHEVKGNTVLKPLQGKSAGPNDAAVLKPLDGSWKGAVISCGINPNFGKIDVYWMAASAIDEALRNNIAVGGRRIALLDNFTWGNPEKPETLGELVRACQACYDYAIAFGTPFVSGKDSLYNESQLGPVTPTLLMTALGIIPDVRNAVSVDVKAADDLVYIIGRTFDELGGSEYYRLKGDLGKNVPIVRAQQASKTFRAVTRAIDAGFIRACHDLADGGLGVSAAEMAFSGGYGLFLDLSLVPCSGVVGDDVLLFSESNSRFLVEVSPNARRRFEKLMQGTVFSQIGKVATDPRLVVKSLNGKTVVNASIGDLLTSWKHMSFGDDVEA